VNADVVGVHPGTRVGGSENIQKGIEILILLFGFSLPLSVAAGFIFMGLIVLLIIFSRSFLGVKTQLCHSPIAWAVFAWWVLHSLGWLYATDHPRALEFWKKATYLALVPFLMTSIRVAILKKAIGAFLLGLTIYHLIVHALQLGWVHFDSLQVGGTPFIARIHYSPMLLFGILLLVHWQRSWKGIRKILAWALIASFLISLVSTEGRTGQILLILILPLWYLFETKNWTIFFLIALGFVLVSSTLFLTMEKFSNRYLQIQQEWYAFQDGDIYTSMGQRFHHYQVAFSIFKNSPFWGHGTGSYRGEHDKLWPEYNVKAMSADNPHNQFLMIMVEFGVIGVFVLIFLFSSLVWGYIKMKNHPFRPILLIFPIMFLLQCLVDTHLYGVPSLTFFIFMTTVLYHPGWGEEMNKA
jgi:O-antigen ligase